MAYLVAIFVFIFPDPFPFVLSIDKVWDKELRFQTKAECFSHIESNKEELYDFAFSAFPDEAPIERVEFFCPQANQFEHPSTPGLDTYFLNPATLTLDHVSLDD